MRGAGLQRLRRRAGTDSSKLASTCGNMLIKKKLERWKQNSQALRDEENVAVDTKVACMLWLFRLW